MIFVDTNVVSETARREPATAVLDWIAKRDAVLALSTVVIAELCFGIESVRADQRSKLHAANLNAWRRRLSKRIFGFDEPAALVFGRIMGEGKLRGRPMSTADGMIAAIALRHGASLATRNDEHFLIPGLVVMKPWSGL